MTLTGASSASCPPRSTWVGKEREGIRRELCSVARASPGRFEQAWTEKEKEFLKRYSERPAAPLDRARIGKEMDSIRGNLDRPARGAPSEDLGKAVRDVRAKMGHFFREVDRALGT